MKANRLFGVMAIKKWVQWLLVAFLGIFLVIFQNCAPVPPMHQLREDGGQEIGVSSSISGRWKLTAIISGEGEPVVIPSQLSVYLALQSKELEQRGADTQTLVSTKVCLGGVCPKEWTATLLGSCEQYPGELHEYFDMEQGKLSRHMVVIPTSIESDSICPWQDWEASLVEALNGSVDLDLNQTNQLKIQGQNSQIIVFSRD